MIDLSDDAVSIVTTEQDGEVHLLVVFSVEFKNGFMLAFSFID